MSANPESSPKPSPKKTPPAGAFTLLGAVAVIAVLVAVAVGAVQISPSDPATAQTPDHGHGSKEPHTHDEPQFIPQDAMMGGPSLPIPVDNDCLIWVSAQGLNNYATALIELNPSDSITTDEERRTLMRLLQLGDYAGIPDFDAPGWNLTKNRYRGAPLHPCIDYISIPLEQAPLDYRNPVAYAQCAPPLAREALARENDPTAVVDSPAAQTIETGGASPELYALSLIAKDAPAPSERDLIAIAALIHEGSVPAACGEYNPRIAPRQAWNPPPRAYPIKADAHYTAQSAPDMPIRRETLKRDGWAPPLEPAPISAQMTLSEMTPTLKAWTLRLIACADDGVNCPNPIRAE